MVILLFCFIGENFRLTRLTQRIYSPSLLSGRRVSLFIPLHFLNSTNFIESGKQREDSPDPPSFVSRKPQSAWYLFILTDPRSNFPTFPEPTRGIAKKIAANPVTKPVISSKRE